MEILSLVYNDCPPISLDYSNEQVMKFVDQRYKNHADFHVKFLKDVDDFFNGTIIKPIERPVLFSKQKQLELSNAIFY